MKQKQFIKCPNCGAVELAAIDHSTVFFSTWIHRCSKCEFIIQESEWEPLKALSIRQPWAWLIVNRYKTIENRNTLKNFTGDFLIHTGLQQDKKWLINSTEKLKKHIEEINFNHPPQIKGEWESGGIIGHAKITGFVEKSDSPWFVGKYGLLIKDANPLPFTPCKGKLGFFKPEIK